MNDSSADSHSPPERRLRLVLAEDDDELRESLAELLEASGYDVMPLAGGEQLLEQMAASLLLEDEGWTADAIVTDIRLPNFNGLSIIEGLRRTGWNTPVIVMSAFADEALPARVSALGRAVFFPKPLAVEALLEALSRLSCGTL